MRQPKPPAEDLTKAGKPRQRAPGGGRKPAGRTARLTRVSPETQRLFEDIQKRKHLATLADAIEWAAVEAHKKL